MAANLPAGALKFPNWSPLAPKHTGERLSFCQRSEGQTKNTLANNVIPSSLQLSFTLPLPNVTKVKIQTHFQTLLPKAEKHTGTMLNYCQRGPILIATP